jgi:hypothetical protein
LSPYDLLLFVHVSALMLAFGPTYAYGIAADMAEREPSHIAFNNRVRELIGRRFTIPGTIVMGLSGLGMLYFGDEAWLDGDHRWLQAGVILYAAAILWTILVTWRTQARIAEVGARLAVERAAAASAAASAASAGASAAQPSATPASPAPARPAGMPPEIAALVHQVRRDGKAMGVVVLLIAFLMVVKPPFPF